MCTELVQYSEAQGKHLGTGSWILGRLHINRTAEKNLEVALRTRSPRILHLHAVTLTRSQPQSIRPRPGAEISAASRSQQTLPIPSSPSPPPYTGGGACRVGHSVSTSLKRASAPQESDLHRKGRRLPTPSPSPATASITPPVRASLSRTLLRPVTVPLSVRWGQRSSR